MESDPKQQANGYFHMIEAVGSNGKYQKIVIALFCIVSLQVGSLSLGNPYYLAVPPYTNCPSQYQGDDCNSYVCNLPIKMRSPFLEQQINQLSTLGNRFGDYHCEKADALSVAKGMFFIGSIVGYIILGIMADNLGRRLTLLICLFTGIIGYLFILIGPNLFTVEIGLFLTGFGLQNAFNLSLYFFIEILQNSQRQKAAILFQSFFCFGGLMMVFYFFIFKNWLPIFWIFCFIPLLFCFVAAAYFIQQTPQFLVKRLTVKDIRKSLLFIAEINGRIKQFNEDTSIKQQALQLLKSEYEKQINSQNKQIFTFWDLVRYKSLHRITLCLSLGVFAVDFLYYAPVMLLDEFGFDFYVNGVIINCSELITYVFSYYFIVGLRRKRTAIILYSIALGCSILLLLQHSNQICEDHCWSFKVVSQLVLIFIFRFSVSLQFQILIVYVLQLYPVQIASVGFSFVSIIGMIPNTFLPELIVVSNRAGFPFMVFFIIGSVVGMLASIPLQQTCGKAPQQKISQFGSCKAPKRDGQIELVEQTG